ncbi:50S ribosomal protein L30 [Halorutilales archaeon Cl-col2-1]
MSAEAESESEQEEIGCYAVVQVRGEVNMSSSVRDTLDMLSLGDVNSCTIRPATGSVEGMLHKVNDYVAYGTPSAETVAELVETRGETEDGDSVTDGYIDENTEYSSVGDFAEAVVEGDTDLKEAGLRTRLRLHPPRGGHSGIKKSYKQGGVLGDHGNEIDDLLRRMR